MIVAAESNLKLSPLLYWKILSSPKFFRIELPINPEEPVKYINFK
jgi:hypothetical protein